MFFSGSRSQSALSSSRSGFTLIEMMIVIAIIAILATFAAAPYNYFSDKQRVRTQVARFEQLVSQAKSEASNGFLFKGGSIEETASTAIEINPNGGIMAPTVNYIRYRPSSPTVYTSCSSSFSSCSLSPITLVDQRIRIKAIGGTTVTSSTSTGYIFFEAPNGSGSQTLSGGISQSDVKLLLQLGDDPTLTKTVTLSPR
ncbi:MAG: prepilin-type N-terminal cleavage/methylation domain-containing protein [Candidatus Gracilibacteria bacterium]